MYESIHHKDEEKKAKIYEIKKHEVERVMSLERKLREKEKNSEQIRKAIEEYSQQRRDLNMQRKQE